MKILVINEEARKKAVHALCTIADAVCTTLGPNARPAIYDKFVEACGETHILSSKDGQTVLNALHFSDPVLHAIHTLAKATCASVVVDAGDGTTSVLRFAATLAKAIIDENHVNPQFFARFMVSEAERAISEITKEAVVTEQMAKLVSMVSTNGDEELANAILQAVTLAGARGTINVSKSPLQKERICINKVNGISNAKGYNYYTPLAFSIDEAKTSANSRLVMHKPFLFLFNGEIGSMRQLDPIIDRLSDKYGKSFNLICVGLRRTEEVAQKLTIINLQTMSKDSNGNYDPSGGRIFLTKVKNTAEINGQVQMLFDLAAFSGGKTFDDASCANPDLNWLGTCEYAEIAADKTTFFGRAKNHTIFSRSKENLEAAANAPSVLDQELINMRNAELTNGLVNLSLGGFHHAQIAQLADAADDAIRAVQSATTKGALPPCGVSYCRAANLAKVHPAMRKALESIHRQLMDNLGLPYDERWWKFQSRKLPSFKRHETIKVNHDGTITRGDFQDLGIADCAATIESVIRHGTNLAVLVATCGALSLTGNLEELNNAKMLKEVFK